MPRPIKPVLFGCSGPMLTEEEAAFFASANPFGFILFQRNVVEPDQVRALVKALRAAVARADAPVFIDQEGGRVARLKPPHWPALPPLRDLGALYERDAAKGLEAMALHTRLTAQRLTDLGINGNCSPMLDLYIEDASNAIGDRALSRRPKVIVAMARVAIEGFLANGVLPVIKHLPGHGRVKVDPHHILPVVDADRATLEAEDFVPFAALRDTPIGMNSHIVFTALDPDAPVSLSQKIHQDIIRGVIGFQGLLFSDDLAMKALNGPLDEIALKALEAGADIALYCPGDLPEMERISRALPAMSQAAAERWSRAQQRLSSAPVAVGLENARTRLASLLPPN